MDGECSQCERTDDDDHGRYRPVHGFFLMWVARYRRYHTGHSVCDCQPPSRLSHGLLRTWTTAAASQRLTINLCSIGLVHAPVASRLDPRHVPARCHLSASMGAAEDRQGVQRGVRCQQAGAQSGEGEEGPLHRRMQGAAGGHAYAYRKRSGGTSTGCTETGAYGRLNAVCDARAGGTYRSTSTADLSRAGRSRRERLRQRLRALAGEPHGGPVLFRHGSSASLPWSARRVAEY